jgi:hypothetical protein
MNTHIQRFYKSVHTFGIMIKLLFVLLALILMWPINPVLAILRVKTPIRRILLRQLPGGEIFMP